MFHIEILSMITVIPNSDYTDTSTSPGNIIACNCKKVKGYLRNICEMGLSNLSPQRTQRSQR